MTVQDLLGIELPIIQAPMAGVQGSALAIAVSEAGGLGSLPCAMLGTDAMRQELAAIRAGTRRPFNVNFFCHTPPVPDAGARGGVARCPRAVLPEFGIDADCDPRRPRARAVQRRGGRRARGVQAAGGELPLRAARAGAARAGARLGREDPVVGDDGRRGALARGARRRRDHRAGPRGRRPSRHRSSPTTSPRSSAPSRCCRRSCAR